MGFPQVQVKRSQIVEIERKVEEMGLPLAAASSPGGTGVGNFVSAVQVGELLFVSGSTGASNYTQRGRVGQDLTVEQGYEAAKFAILGGLQSVKNVLGDLDRVQRIVKLLGFVNAPEGFGDSPRVINGASDLLIALYGENGRHARSAIGVAALPANAPVEIEMIVQVKAG
jgi:enamine deaminase RidA (YjgF/YER057c/UK114 family)